MSPSSPPCTPPQKFSASPAAPHNIKFTHSAAKRADPRIIVEHESIPQPLFAAAQRSDLAPDPQRAHLASPQIERTLSQDDFASICQPDADLSVISNYTRAVLQISFPISMARIEPYTPPEARQPPVASHREHRYRRISKP